MESKENINKERRTFFTKLGLGAVSAALLSMVPLKMFAVSKPVEKKNISVSINPLAVQRSTQGLTQKTRESK